VTEEVKRGCSVLCSSGLMCVFHNITEAQYYECSQRSFQHRPSAVIQYYIHPWCILYSFLIQVTLKLQTARESNFPLNIHVY